MATPQPLMSVAFRSGDQDYRLTSQGALFVETMGGSAFQEVYMKTLALKILYGELAKHIEPQKEEEPDGPHLP